jgi:hypothetical protein
MPEKPWIYLINPFIVATNGSYELMRTLGTFTDSRLAANPTFATQYAFLHPKYTAFIAAYDAWKIGGGVQKSSTATLNALLDDLGRQVNDWDYEIQAFAKKGTPEYLTYFPHGHAPFTKGKQETKIGAVAELAGALALRTPVPPIKDTISDYLTDLNTANSTQKNKKGSTDDLSDAVEAARITLGGALYSVMGHLISVYWETPELVGNFLDLELLRKKPQETFTGHTGPQEHETIVKRTLDADDQVTLHNTGLVPLTFYLANTKNGGIPAGVTGVTLQPTEQTHVPASSLGHPAEDKFLSVYNASEIAEGEWEVEL